jgi:hypothetical protein
LLSYLPLRKTADSASEMVSALLFGESYTVVSEQNGFLEIICDYDSYHGWISKPAYSQYEADYSQVNEHTFLEASGEHQIMFLPCGALMPPHGKLRINNQTFTIERKLKTNNHLPLSLRLQKLALSFLNTPYLWGGRSFMGMDCSGLMQVVFKANSIYLPRDTSEQVHCGKEVKFEDRKACDLLFFSKPDTDKVVHVGMLLDKDLVVHAGPCVRTDQLQKDGLHFNGEHRYKLLTIKRMI